MRVHVLGSATPCLDFAAVRPMWTAHDASLVETMRARRAGWDAVAAALGQRTPDVRARFDPGYDPLGVGAPPTRTAPPAEAAPQPAPPRQLKRGSRKADVLSRVDGRRTSRMISDLLGITQTNASVVLHGLMAEGLVARSSHNAPATLTDAGRAELEGHHAG